MNMDKIRNINSIEDMQNEDIDTQIVVIVSVVGSLIGEVETLKNRVKLQDVNIEKLTRLIGDS
jgi:hypothetical protein